MKGRYAWALRPPEQLQNLCVGGRESVRQRLARCVRCHTWRVGDKERGMSVRMLKRLAPDPSTPKPCVLSFTNNEA